MASPSPYLSFAIDRISRVGYQVKFMCLHHSYLKQTLSKTFTSENFSLLHTFFCIHCLVSLKAMAMYQPHKCPLALSSVSSGRFCLTKVKNKLYLNIVTGYFQFWLLFQATVQLTTSSWAEASTIICELESLH